MYRVTSSGARGAHGCCHLVRAGPRASWPRGVGCGCGGGPTGIPLTPSLRSGALASQVCHEPAPPEVVVAQSAVFAVVEPVAGPGRDVTLPITGAASPATLEGPYTLDAQPILSPDPADPWAGLGAQGRSRSAIRLLGSQDGRRFQPISDGPILSPGEGWTLSHVYALDVRPVGGLPRLWFNARDDWRWSRGRKALGMAIGVTPAAQTLQAPV